MFDFLSIFVQKAKIVHGNKYDYSKVIFDILPTLQCRENVNKKLNDIKTRGLRK